MKIGIDLSFVRPDHKNGGTETYIKNLMKGFSLIGKNNEFIYFIHEDIHKDYKNEFPEIEFYIYKLRGNHKIRTLIFQSIFLPDLIKKLELSAMFFPTFSSGIRKKFKVPVIVNPQDIQFKYLNSIGLIKKLYRDFFYKNSLSKSDGIIATSNYVKSTLLESYKNECNDKIVTIYIPIDFNYDNQNPIEYIKSRFILSVNTLHGYKNLITLIKAYENISEKTDRILVLVGIKGSGVDELKAYLEKKHLEQKVIITGYVTNEQLNWLYTKADLFVTTSLYEGFGMTPIEAMGAGIKVISTKCTSLPEVTMNLANYYEPAKDSLALSNKILEVLNMNDTANILANQRQVLEKYSLATIANEYYRYFEEIIH